MINMAEFDDSTDPELGAACNRLSAFTLPLPEGAVVDPASGLTEPDLVLILRHLHAIRHERPDEGPAHANAAERLTRASVPITAKG